MADIQYRILHYDNLHGKDYVEVALGKLRKKKFKKTSIFFDPLAFSLFEGALWSKYREYSPTTTNAIVSNDWIRIIEGLEEIIPTIESSNTFADLKKILQLRSHDKLPAYGELLDFKRDVIMMFRDFTTWASTNAGNEEYLTICV